jgi:hypothetical protein
VTGPSAGGVDQGEAPEERERDRGRPSIGTRPSPNEGLYKLAMSFSTRSSRDLNGSLQSTVR